MLGILGKPALLCGTAPDGIVDVLADSHEQILIRLPVESVPELRGELRTLLCAGLVPVATSMLRGFEVRDPRTSSRSVSNSLNWATNSALVTDLSGMLGGARQRLALCCFR